MPRRGVTLSRGLTCRLQSARPNSNRGTPKIDTVLRPFHAQLKTSRNADSVTIAASARSHLRRFNVPVRAGNISLVKNADLEFGRHLDKYDAEGLLLIKRQIARAEIDRFPLIMFGASGVRSIMAGRDDQRRIEQTEVPRGGGGQKYLQASVEISNVHGRV